MTDWTAGYRVDVDYTHGYYAELNPLTMQLSMLLAGLRPPEVSVACDLGYGQGVSLNVHAAASQVAWHGTDFNPAHTATARSLAAASGAAAQCDNDAFIDYAGRDDLPEFDFIALHGIWSWVSEENRRAILRLIDRRLRVGGVVYIGYNTMPGWAPILPLRELLLRHFDGMTPAAANATARLDASLAFAQRLMATNPAVARVNPALQHRLEMLQKQNRTYLVHEYFNRHWQPQSVVEMSEQLSQARLRLACPARFLDMVDPINLSAEHIALLAEVDDPVMRALLRDFMTNTSFRRDYWVKGAQPLPAVERTRRLRALRVMLLRPAEGLEMKVTGALGEADLLPAIYGPVLEALSSLEPTEIGVIEQRTAGQGVGLALLLEAVTVLLGRGILTLVQTEDAAEAARPGAAALNRHLMAGAETGEDIAVLASPLTGGGVPLGRFQQLFLSDCIAHGPDAGRMVERVWTILREQGQVLLKDGQPMQDEAENRGTLQRLAEDFLARDLDMLRRLRIA